MKRSRLAIAVCTTAIHSLAVCAVEIEITPGANEIQLMPAGEFRARDGRPEETDNWYIDATIAQRVIALAHARQTPFVIDYEHQTLTAKDKGHAAPAAGWFSRLEWREGEGLYAVDVAWTPNATQYLKNKEYRFISPVFSYTKSGDVVELLMAAITNSPALDGMNEILAAASTRFNKQTSEETKMDLVAELRKALGLAEDADEKAILAALNTVLTDKKNADTQVAQLTTDLEKAGNPDPAKYVSVAVVEDLKTQVADLSARIVNSEVEDLVEVALSDGRLLPAQEEWAITLGKSNLESLKGYLKNAQPIAALTRQQTTGKKPGEDGYTPDDDLVAVCGQMGVAVNDAVEYIKEA